MASLAAEPTMLSLSRPLHVHRFVDVESPAAYASPEAAVLARLFANLVTDYLNELAYPADLAGAQAIGFCRQVLCLGPWQHSRRSNTAMEWPRNAGSIDVRGKVAQRAAAASTHHACISRSGMTDVTCLLMVFMRLTARC